MRSISRFPWIAPAIVVAIALVVYRNTFSGPFIFDDASSITNNPSIRSLWPLSAVFAPPSECTVAGRPFANLTFALNYACHGTRVQGYHFVNLGFHIGAALFLFGAMRRTLELTAPDGGVRGDVQPAYAGQAWGMALVATAIWTAHPLMTASVTYLSQRTEVLMGFFYLGTIYAFIRGAKSPSWPWLSISVASCFLGVASKEVMATAPLVVFLYDRTFLAGTFRAAWGGRKAYYLALATSWLFLWLLMSGLKDRSVGFELGVSPWTYALTECRTILLYLKLVVWPEPLVFDYGVSFIDHLAEGWPYVAGLAMVVATVFVALIRAPRAGFLGAAFLLILAPTSSVVPVATQPYAENRLYLPAAAAIALLVIALNRSVGGRSWFILAASAAAMMGVAVERNQAFRSGLALWTDTVAKRPDNPRAHAILGEMLHEARRLPEAKAQFEAALRLKATYPEAHSNLGTTLYELGDGLGAKSHFEEAVRLKPDYASAHSNLGNLLLQLGDVEKAAYHCEEALRLYSDPNRLKPDLAEAHNNLGNARLYQRKLPEARQQYQSAVELKPGFHEARMNLGVVLRLLGEFDQSRRELERVVEAKPDFPEAQFNLGILLEQMGRNDDAIRCLNRAVELKPDFAEARYNLAQLLRRRGDLDGAKKQLEVVVRLRPADAGARTSLETVLALLRGENRPNSGPP